MELLNIDTAPKTGVQILVFARGIFTVVKWNSKQLIWELTADGAFADDSEFDPEFWIAVLNEPAE